jgi:alpha-1,2-mannosyltransferase
MGQGRLVLRGQLLWRRAGAPSPYAIALLVASLGGYLVVRWLTKPSMIDLVVYRAEGSAVRAGTDLYGALPSVGDYNATYPPFAALLFVPLTLIPTTVMIWAAVAVNMGLLVLVSLLSCRLVGVDPRSRPNVALVVAAVAMWSEPVFTTFRYGQINLAVLALVLWDFTRPPAARTRGVALGVAAGIKVVPGIFIGYLLLTRRFRMAAVASATFAATVAVSAMLLPHAAWEYWSSLLFDTGRVGRPENAANQTIRGLIVRIDHTRDISALWTLLSLALLMIGVAIAVLAYRRLGDRWGLLACAIASLVAAPISWTHHWVWCVPIALLLWYEARRWLAAVLVFWTFAVWAVPHTDSLELAFSPWQISMSAWYVAFGLFFLVLTLRLALRERAEQRSLHATRALASDLVV